MDQVSEELWEYLSEYLEADPHPGAGFLKENLSEYQHNINSSPTGAVLVVEDLNEENSWLAMAGLVVGCGIIRLQFIYVIPEERDSEIFGILMSRVTDFARENYYGFVEVKCPDGFGLKAAHDIFSELAANASDEVMPCGHSVVRYMIPRAEWEKVFK